MAKHPKLVRNVDSKARIVEMVYIKQAVALADRAGLWEYRLPAVAATEAKVAAAERELGLRLEEEYRQFLLHADGWPGFYQAVDLFGTEDLVGGALADRGLRLLRDLESEVLNTARLRTSDALPIAVSRHDLDLFVLTKPTSPRPGEVIWFAGYEIDRFASFHEYFLAMEDYNRQEVESLRTLQP